MKQRRVGSGHRAAMCRGLLLLAGATAVLAIASCSGRTTVSAVVSDPVSQAGQSPTQSPTKGPAPSPDPDAGLTPDQVYAKQQAGEAANEQKRLDWLNSPQVQAIDWRSLRKESLDFVTSPGRPTFEDALDQADLVVLGHVVSVHPDAHGTVMSFAVERKAKGSGIPSVMTVDEPGCIEPEDNFQSAYLTSFDGVPILLPGDRAVLLLQHGQASGKYFVEAYSGEYASTNGKVKAVKGSPFHDVDGATETELMDRADRHFKGAS